MFPKTLEEIKDFLQQHHLSLTQTTRDGRVNSAFNEDEIFVGSFNFAISEDSISTDQSETVKIAKIDSEQWRIEENLNERNITVTINSETEINTLWNGIVNIPGLGEYRYEISCIFRKQ